MNFKNSTACFRTWIVNNKEIINIVFYQNGEILSQTEKGFLEATGEHGITLNIDNIPEIENVKKSTKLNLNRTDCFTYKSTFYIYAPLVNCTPTKEVLRDEDEFGKQQYINAFTITITHKGELETFTIYGASYTRSALTGLSIVSEELKQYLDSIGFDDISTHDTNKMVKNAESIIAILNKAQSPK